MIIIDRIEKRRGESKRIRNVIENFRKSINKKWIKRVKWIDKWRSTLI
jgi:hypothetical protein